MSDYLASNNIETRNSYPALSFQSYLNDIEKSKVEYSEKISNNVLWLPSSTNLKQQDIDFICELIQKFDNEVAV